MTEKYINKLILIFTIMAIVGFGTYALAQMGMGYGLHGDMHYGPAWQHHGYGSQGYGGFWGNLSEDEIKQVQAEREAFFEATKEIRQQLYQKRLELRSELAKKDPDTEKAIGLQKEISELKGQMGLKRLDHILKLKKINPDVGRGLMGRGRRGYGMMGPGVMGSGMMDPGMMGPGMMDSGMMGPGGARNMMPGWSDRNYPQQYRQGAGAVEEKDAGIIVSNYIKSTRNPNLETGKVKDMGEVFEVEIVTKDKSLVDKVLVDKKSGRIRSAY
jgi:Spy/CpxP family protein refolding chaperone